MDRGGGGAGSFVLASGTVLESVEQRKLEGTAGPVAHLPLCPYDLDRPEWVRSSGERSRDVVQGFDVRTGERLWSSQVIGEGGRES